MAQDLKIKRQMLARQSTAAAENFVNSLAILLSLSDERSVFGAGNDFTQGDFDETSDLTHLTPDMMNTLFDFVVPSLRDNYNDAANGGRNRQLLLQVRH